MTLTAHEAFEKGTATFNAHDLDGFAEVLAETSFSRRQAVSTAREKRPAPHSLAVGSLPSRMRASKSMPFTSSTTS